MVGLLALWLGTLAASPAQKSDPLCPHIVPCQYEAPAFNIRVVDEQTGQPLADVHAIAAWVIYAGNRYGVLMAVEAVSGSDGNLSFHAWGPIRSFSLGMRPGVDPVITLYRAGYRAKLVYNATPPELPHTARVRAFQEPRETIAMTPFQGRTPAEKVASLWEAAEPLDGGNVSQHDPESIRLIYVRRWRRILTEAEQLPRVPQVQHLRSQLDKTIQIFAPGR
jgi:hypothetical protein